VHFTKQTKPKPNRTKLDRPSNDDSSANNRIHPDPSNALPPIDLPSGHAHGVALHESFGSIVAQVAEVSLKGGMLRVHRVVCAIDCGTVVNPGTVAQQVESSVNFALSAALFGKIDIQEGVVQQNNFTNYALVQMAQSPVVETWIVPSTQAPEGVGEPAVPPLAPAVANAMFKLTGQRLRSLPLKA
jgi:isoquinoline 1-oxidoreductase beta subunit